MIAGRRPFGGNNIAAIFRAITQDTPASPDQGNPFIPKALSDMVLKCLAKHPEHRYQTGRQLADAIIGILPSLQNAAQKVKTPHKDATHRKPLLLVGVFSALIILGGFVYWFSSPSETSAPSPLSPNYSNSTANTPRDISAVERQPSVQQATLNISSEPEGAKVFVDNVIKGKTPVKVPIPEGKYELRLSLPGYFEWEAQVDISGETPLRIPMRPLE